MAGDFEELARNFWERALALYDRPGVAALGLELQDRAALDVNLLLLCLWAGMDRGLALTAVDLETLDLALVPWRRQVVEPLRTARRFLKGDPSAAALRDLVKVAELDAERLGQRRLLAALPDRPAGVPSLALALANLERYAGPDAALSFAALFEAGAAPLPRPSA